MAFWALHAAHTPHIIQLPTLLTAGDRSWTPKFSVKKLWRRLLPQMFLELSMISFWARTTGIVHWDRARGGDVGGVVGGSLDDVLTTR